MLSVKKWKKLLQKAAGKEIFIRITLLRGGKWTTKAHALEDQEARKMSEQLRKVAEKGLQLDMIQTYFSSISWVAFQIFQVFCLAFTAYIAWKGIIGVGDITLYQTYFSSIVAQIASIVTLLPIIAKGLESVESIGDVLCANDIENMGKIFPADNGSASPLPVHFYGIRRS